MDFIIKYALSTEKLHLGDHTVETLRYLKTYPRLHDEPEDAKRFLEWKAALGMSSLCFYLIPSYIHMHKIK